MPLYSALAEMNSYLYILITVLVAVVISWALTPAVKRLSLKIGAVDVPRDDRRMHDRPIPRMGGLAIFLSFLVVVLLFVPLDKARMGMLIGSIVIVAVGVLDDVISLPAWFKLLFQVVAALIATLLGNRIEVVSNPNIFSGNPHWELGILSVPATVIWIVLITNAVNLIDGLDGLACGVSAISSVTLLVIALLVAEMDVAVIMAALAGACLGFLPYNINPAKIFMGDTGATFLGFIMAAMSVEGMFKMYNLISFVVPFLMLGLPIFDTLFAIARRLSRGQSPMRSDRSHVHHRLMDLGLSQKQAVGILYVLSTVLGLSAVLLTAGGARGTWVMLALLLITLVIAAVVGWYVFTNSAGEKHKKESDKEGEKPGDGR